MTPRLNSWSLFWVLALAASIADLLGLPEADFHSARGMLPIILRSVRCALPLFLVAFTASSLATLWPSAGTRWLLANRRYIGLAFAFGMAWHFSFVAYTIWTFGNPLNAKATALDVIGFVFLLLLTLTSFRSFARHLSRVNWRRLHKTGVYVIWLVATATYFYSVRDGGDLFHRVVFAVLLAAWGLRAAAWGKRRFTGGSAATPTSAVRQP
jgi:DMSO/TMAO reductase YedYZ heme-binding membrane subunit